MGPRDPAAKLTDLRPSHGDASTHWGRENGGGTLNVHRDPRNPRVKDNRPWDDDIRVLNTQTHKSCRSFKLNSVFPDTAHARAENPVQRTVSALRRGQREAT